MSGTALQVYMNYVFFKLHSNQWNRCWFSVVFFFLKEVTEAQGQLSVDTSPDGERITPRACPLSHHHTSSVGHLSPPSFGISVSIASQVTHLLIWQSFTRYQICPRPHGTSRSVGLLESKIRQRIGVSDAVDGDRS